MRRERIKGYPLFLRFWRGASAGLLAFFTSKSGMSWPWSMLVTSILSGLALMIDKYLRLLNQE